MAQPNTGTNRYNPNSGSQNDIIDQMIAQGASDAEIYAALQKLQQGGGTADAAGGDATGGIGGLTFEQLQALSGADPEQQQTDNLLTLYKLLQGDDQQSNPVQLDTPSLQLPQGSNVNIPTAAPFSGDPSATKRDEYLMGLAMRQAMNADQTMRGRNREDAMWQLQNQPAPQLLQPASASANPQRQALLDAIIGRLMPKAQEAAPPPAQNTGMTPGGNDPRSTEGVFETGQVPPPVAEPQWWGPGGNDPTNIQQVIRNRLMGVGR